MGCKVTVTVFSQDNGQAQPEGEVSNLQIATPFMLYGFPAVVTQAANSYANQWDGSPSNQYTADTIPQMKYGFRRISPGLGGRNMIKYSTYWDFAKITGQTREQYLADTNWAFDPDGTSFSFALRNKIMLVLALADYTPAIARQCTVDIKIEQYGRWEGQEITYF